MVLPQDGELLLLRLLNAQNHQKKPNMDQHLIQSDLLRRQIYLIRINKLIFNTLLLSLSIILLLHKCHFVQRRKASILSALLPSKVGLGDLKRVFACREQQSGLFSL